MARDTDRQNPAWVQLLDDLVLSINRGKSLEEVFNLVFERLQPFVPYHRIAVALIDTAQKRLTIVHTRSDGRVVLGRGYSGDVAGSSLEPLIEEGRTRIINDLPAYLARKPESESTRLIVKEGMRSSLTLPLVASGQPVGVMFFSSRDLNTYRPEHEEFLRAVVGHVAIAVERSRLIEELRERGEFLENVLHSSADAILVVDPQNRFRQWNDGARRMLGWESEEVLGRDYDLIVPPEAGAMWKDLQDRVHREGFVKDHECVRLTKDGRRLTVNLTSTLLLDKQGRLLGSCSVLRDVTHVKRLQHDLITAQSLAAVGEMAAQVAHEIKNPLAGISGAIQVLADAMPTSDPRRDVIQEVLHQITRLDNTVRDLLSFSRPLLPSYAPTDLRESLARAWSLLAPGAPKIEFVLDAPPSLVVEADPQLLHQVWVNLFQNAAEAMAGGGRLTAAVADGPSVRVEVRDTGPGITPAAYEKLFKPFFTTKTRGTGLGLAIARKMIEAHRGRIWAEPGDTQGTVFKVELPR